MTMRGPYIVRTHLDGGPCQVSTANGKCGHADCQRRRAIASVQCDVCGQRIGQECAYYAGNDGVRVHAHCAVAAGLITMQEWQGCSMHTIP